MAELLTPWEMTLAVMDMNDWLELNPCGCEALCTCQEENSCFPS
jgi:hypothetical protein